LYFFILNLREETLTKIRRIAQSIFKFFMKGLDCFLRGFSWLSAIIKRDSVSPRDSDADSISASERRDDRSLAVSEIEMNR
jgi:hypothetical protein